MRINFQFETAMRVVETAKLIEKEDAWVRWFLVYEGDEVVFECMSGFEVRDWLEQTFETMNDLWPQEARLVSERLFDARQHKNPRNL